MLGGVAFWTPIEGSNRRTDPRTVYALHGRRGNVPGRALLQNAIFSFALIGLSSSCEPSAPVDDPDMLKRLPQMWSDFECPLPGGKCCTATTGEPEDGLGSL